MSIAFRPLSAAFGAERAAEQAQPPVQFHANEGASSRAYGMTGQISAAPWGGLYLELPEETVESGATNAQPSSDLERFLTGLMIGE